MRSIQVVSKRSYPPRPSHSVVQPHDKKLAAGKPAPADEAPHVLFSREQVGDGKLHQIWISGESMSPILYDGDLVTFREQDTAIDGDMVVARFMYDTTDEPEFTVKWYRQQDGFVRLIPENPAYEPLDGGQATVIGKVVAYTRRL
jgi:repressor LexA